MTNFGQFLAKMGKTGIFFKKAIETFFSLLKALIKCKVSEKSNERFSSNSVTYVRTYVRTHGRTDGRESLGLQRLRRETKNPYKMRMHYPIRIILVPLNFILQGLSDKDKNKYVI